MCICFIHNYNHYLSLVYSYIYSSLEICLFLLLPLLLIVFFADFVYVFRARFENALS